MPLLQGLQNLINRQIESYLCSSYFMFDCIASHRSTILILLIINKTLKRQLDLYLIKQIFQKIAIKYFQSLIIIYSVDKIFFIS